MCAIGLTAFCFFCIVFAFCTPWWLVTDGKLPAPKFQQLGLWEVCFNKFEDFDHWYDYKFTGCWWVFEEEYYIIFDFLLPGFFLLTQFFFTLTLTLVLVATFLTWLYCFCSRDHDKYVLLLTSLGADLVIAGICGLIACLIFGNNGDRRDWMPNWEHNDLSWSFAFACVGSLLLIPAGALFLVEAKRANYRRLLASRPPSQYDMEVRKPTGSES